MHAKLFTPLLTHLKNKNKVIAHHFHFKNCSYTFIFEFIIFQIEKMSMDPLEFIHVDVLPNVFQHFSVKNLLQASLVSTKWNEFIGSSSKCMQKIWVKFYAPFKHAEVLLKSQRKYQNFKMQRNLDGKIRKMFFKTLWKSGMLRDMKFTLRQDYLEIMEYLAPSIENLECWNISFSTQNSKELDLFTPICFPVLRSLECHIVEDCIEIFSLFFGQISNLNQLVLTMDHSYRNEQNPGYEILKFNQHVKKLSLDSNTSAILGDVGKNLNVQLESLKISLIHDENLGKEIAEFFKIQKELEKITVDLENSDNNSKIFIEIWNSMRCCNTFEILNAPIGFGSSLNLQVQPSVTKLKVIGEPRFIHGLLSSTLNLEILQVGQLTDEILTFSAYSLKNLKRIEFVNHTGQVDNFEILVKSVVGINKKIILQQKKVNDFLYVEI